jgi:phosphatidylserine decarboxylase
MRLAPGAWRYAAVPLALAALTAAVSPLASAALLAVAAGVLLFFRDPERTPPPGAGAVSPADGTVTVVREESDRVRVGIFLSPTDVHVVRAPADGTVEAVEHRPGAHRPAFTKESERNERVDVSAGDYDLSLIAGWFARRITPYVEPDEALARGQRVGHIAFGSRVDVLLAPEVDRDDLAVGVDDTVRAGETVLLD